MLTGSHFWGAFIIFSLFPSGQLQHAGQQLPDLPSLCVAKGSQGSVESGVCVSVRSQIRFCPPLHRLFREAKWEVLKEHYCHQSGSTLIAKVCCPLSVYAEVSGQDIEPDHSNHENLKLLPVNGCGTSFQYFQLPKNGKTAEVKPGHFPWMARLEFTDYTGNASQYACSATLISKRYVLTAAHCFKNKDYMLKSVRLAENNDDKETECITITGCSEDCANNDNEVVTCSKAEDFFAEEIKVHAGYTGSPGSQNDIALIRLSKDVNITSFFIRPICLPFLQLYNNTDELDDSKLIEVRREGENTGWRRTSNDESSEGSVLKHSVVQILPNVMCQLTHRNNTVTKSQLCAGRENGQGPCLGDSGTPLVYSSLSRLNGENTQRKFQTGIVSYGVASLCELGDVPVVYTRVRSYLSWILDNLKK